MSRYVLARCELYSCCRHNMDNDTDEINNKILCMDTIETNEYIDYINNRLYIDSIYYVLNRIPINDIKIRWESGVRVDKNNWIEFCKTFDSMLEDPFYNKIHLIEKKVIVDKNNNEWTTCIIKTYLISIIQRKWKKIYSKRKEIIRRRMNPNNLHYWQLHGKWPQDCILPTISDMNI